MKMLRVMLRRGKLLKVDGTFRGCRHRRVSNFKVHSLPYEACFTFPQS